MFVEAVKRAGVDGRWVMVEACSAESRDCEIYSVTLGHPAVASWLAANAVTARCDVQHDGELARTLRIRTVPTLIAFKEGAERGRLRGLRDWTDVALWLHELDRVKVDVVAAGTRIAVNVGERRDLAKELLRSGRYQEATDQYLWLWRNIPKVATHLADVRLSFIIKEIDSLVRACPAAEEQFIAIRDRTALIADANPTSTDSRGDWVALNSILGDDERTLSWFDRVKGDQGSATLLLSIRQLLIEPLRLRSRWANLGRLVVDPLSELALAHSVVVNPIPVQIPAKAAHVLGGDPQAKVVDILANQFRGEAADLVTCLRAAGRHREALDVKNEALRLDPSPEMMSILEQGPERYD